MNETFPSPVRPLPVSAADPRPRDNELDLFGVTHVGRVRQENQDHFLVCTVHPQVVLHATSLPDPEALLLRGERLATIFLVADGVGGSAAGSMASRLATEAVTQYVASSLRSYHAAGSTSEGEFMDALRAGALAAHAAVRAGAEARPEAQGMATTLSIGVVVYPWLYVVQVGDSRCYFYQDGALRQVTRDQTVAQDLVDEGVLEADRAQKSPLSQMLSSAIGATEARPEISRVDVSRRGCVILLCTDGLTKHVSDAEIAARLASMTSSEEAGRALLQMALDRGGSDNVTLVVARAHPAAGEDRVRGG